MNKLKVLELFGGIGACSKALERLGIDYEIADYVEIDKYAVVSFNAMHNTNFEPQDITTYNKDIDVDLIMHGSPCQDFSLAGLQAGGDKNSGTRSSLMYETIRIVEKLKPKYVIWENVKNLLSKKHIHNFNAYLEAMEQLGYANYYQVLNAKEYGIPQNRERVFTISIRKDLGQEFIFPSKQELELKLKDMLEDEVDEKYYLSDKMIKYVCARMPMGEHHITTGIHMENKDSENVAGTICTELGNKPSDNYIIDNDDIEYSKEIGYLRLKQVGQIYGTEKEPNPQDGRIYDASGLTPTLDTHHIPKMLIKNATKKGYLEAEEGDGVDVSGRMQYHRGTVQKQMVQTINTNQDYGVVVKDKLPGAYGREFGSKGKLQDTNDVCDTLQAAMGTGGGNVPIMNSSLRIRKLTPKECWRLMGFDDKDYEKAAKLNSNAQLYKQAGNSIVVNVLEGILSNLLK